MTRGKLTPAIRLELRQLSADAKGREVTRLALNLGVTRERIRQIIHNKNPSSNYRELEKQAAFTRLDAIGKPNLSINRLAMLAETREKYVAAWRKQLGGHHAIRRKQ